MAYLRWLISTLPATAGLMAAPGCIIADPNHCSNSDEPCLAAQVCDPCTPSSQTPSANGCVATADAVDLDPNQAGCQLGGASTDTPNTDGTMTTTNMSTETDVDVTTVDPDTTATTEADSTSTTSGGACDDCGGATPYCVEDSCVGCDALPGAGCSDIDPGTPACNPDTGNCQLCTVEESSACEGETPACVDNTCVACTEHAQCPDSACNLAVGSCMPDDQVLYVDNSYAMCDMGVGSVDDPMCEITDAITALGDIGTVRVFPGNPYDPAVNILNDEVFAVIGWEGEPVIGTGGGGVPEIVRVLGGTLYLSGVHLSGVGGTSAALRCTNSGVWIDDSRITGNVAASGVGIDASGCNPLQIRRSQIMSNEGGGILAATCQTQIVNSFVGNNGVAGFSAVPGISFTNGAFEVLYSSVGFNGSTGADGIL